MTTRLTRDAFLRNLTDSGLLSTQEFDRALEEQLGLPSADGEAVAHCLIAAGKLTAFQAEAVRERQFDRLVIGNYQVLDRLGAGGMGTVYKARHRRMKRIVAIKVLSRDIAKSPGLVERFQREVEAVARLNHPNIVVAHDADEAEAGHFLVMEFVDGRDLASEVQQRGPLPVREAVDCIRQAATAMEYAHGQGIIHRDIKPANLLRDAAGTVKVADLGLARINDPIGQPVSERNALTQAGTIMGTADFLPPEQALGLSNVDHRADIYSLGCTLHFLLLGRAPYETDSLMATLIKHREAPIPSLTAARDDVPLPLDDIFRRMVAKKSFERFPTMAAVAAALEAVQANSPEKSAVSPGRAAPARDEPAASASAPAWEGRTILAKPPPANSQTVDLRTTDTALKSALKVLLVEPSRTQSGIIRKYLLDRGIKQLWTAASGREALRQAEREPPDAIVSALHLSDMTGVQLAQQIRAACRGAGPGFVLISSEGAGSDVGSLSNVDKAVVLHKPFTPGQLVDALSLVAAVQPPADAAAARAKVRTLIVDDSASARKHIQAVLAGLGLCQFAIAADGAQAVAAVAGGTFDLIVTDYNMPYMDGRGLIGYLKQNPSTAAVPIIMVTTEKNQAKLEEVRRLGVAVCDKHFPPEVAQKVIDQLVNMP